MPVSELRGSIILDKTIFLLKITAQYSNTINKYPIKILFKKFDN